MTEREHCDVLLVSPGTTAGWRRADADLAEALRALGLRVEVCTTDFRVARHLRRGVIATDLAEAAAMRRALSRALRRHEARAIVYSSPQAAMLQPRGRLRGHTAVRFDAPAALNRRGPGTGLLHALERRALSAVRLLLPIGLRVGEQVLPPRLLPVPFVPLPIPVTVTEGAAAERKEPLALAYAANPEKKGLDVLARAWASAAPQGWRLVVTGADAETARRFLEARAIPEPAGVEWVGLVDPAGYGELLTRASVFLAASRYEDYGIAQLEALGAGALLVTAASPGPYEALRLARELDARLVDETSTAEGLAAALEAATALGTEERRAYRQHARELLAPYRRDVFIQRVERAVLPALLG